MKEAPPVSSFFTSSQPREEPVTFPNNEEKRSVSPFSKVQSAVGSSVSQPPEISATINDTALHPTAILDANGITSQEARNNEVIQPKADTASKAESAKQQTPRRPSILDLSSAQVDARPKKKVFTEADRKRLVEDTARVALTQRDGILHYMISIVVSKTLSEFWDNTERSALNKIISMLVLPSLALKFADFC